MLCYEFSNVSIRESSKTVVYKIFIYKSYVSDYITCHDSYHSITSRLQNKNLLDKQIYVEKNMRTYDTLQGQKHAHSDTNNVDGETKRRRLDTLKK